MLLADKVALITGGAGLNGLGFATARMMAAQGARIVVLDLERADPAAAAARLGQQHLGLVADVTDKASCERAAKAVLETCGRIDILVNNAGITQPRKTAEISGADCDAVPGEFPPPSCRCPAGNSSMPRTRPTEPGCWPRAACGSAWKRRCDSAGTVTSASAAASSA